MNPRNTGILLLLTAAVGAFVYFYEIRGEEARTQAEADAKRLFPGIEAEAIDSIELTTSDGVEARIERSQGNGGDAGWDLVTPLAFPADSFPADALASSLSGLASERKLDDPQPPEVYGLDSTSTERPPSDNTCDGIPQKAGDCNFVTVRAAEKTSTKK